jgi:hypothetical protein
MLTVVEVKGIRQGPGALMVGSPGKMTGVLLELYLFDFL